MKSNILILASTAFFLFSFSSLSAQTEMTAKKYDNPQWQRIVYVDYHSGMAGKARDIIEDYYKKASKMAGTPSPVIDIEMSTGEYDYIYIWNLEGGLEDMNWEVSPNNIKWRKALVSIAGSEEKADAIRSEYNSYVRSAKSELGRKLN
ncbi:MAG: hypothetical protein R2788_01880 [Saprospiraceae bacterium]|jgi:hypothetical protein